MTVLAEISEDGGGNRIHVTWPPCDSVQFKAWLSSMSMVAGRRFSKHPKAHWSVPLDMDTCRQLRAAFGKQLQIGPWLRKWAREQVTKEHNLGSLAAADTAALGRLPEALPDLAMAIHLGPRGIDMTPMGRAAAYVADPPSYQAADVAFMAGSDAPLNANEMGTGKTIELIASVFEAGTDGGPQMVIAPISSMNTVWKRELTRWQPHSVLVAKGSKAERNRVLGMAKRWADQGRPFWLIVNPAMITFEKDPTESSKVHLKNATQKQVDAGACCQCGAQTTGHFHYQWRHPLLPQIAFNNIVLDEAHRAAIGNTKSLTYAALNKLKGTKRTVLTGTPMGGKPEKLFGILHWLKPHVFTSKWNWAERWLEVTNNGFGKKIGGIRPELKEEFYKSLSPYVLRRTKGEIAKWLPPKQYVDHWVEMEGAQLKQYQKWDADVDIEIGEMKIVGQGVLDMYTRLRQFAIALQVERDGKLVPTQDSCKLERLWQIIEELGIGGEDADGDEQLVIFSQFTEVVDMITEWLRERGVRADKITGKVSQADRDRLQGEFQDGGFRVMVMNVKAGGVAITLDRASNVVFMDETWNPDDQSQAEDRCHRVSRIHQVTVHYIRTKDSIEERVFDHVTGKQMTNEEVLDLRRGVVSGSNR